MAKKLDALADDGDQQLTDAVRESARQIWQAGLGAFAKAQQQGGPAFSQLVQEGSEVQRRARTGATWDKLEQVFEERVARALLALDVPTAAEVAALRARIDELSAAVARLPPPAAKSRKK
jgi:polyhydroxyalkanoate synthesis regulator phasin